MRRPNRARSRHADSVRKRPNGGGRLASAARFGFSGDASLRRCKPAAIEHHCPVSTPDHGQQALRICAASVIGSKGLAITSLNESLEDGASEGLADAQGLQVVVHAAFGGQEDDRQSVVAGLMTNQARQLDSSQPIARGLGRVCNTLARDDRIGLLFRWFY